MHKIVWLLPVLPFTIFSQTKEPWIEKPKEQWPAIALVNDVLYKNGDRHQDPSVTYVGTGFLLNTGDDTVAVTVKHVLFAARNNETDRVVVNDQLKKWKMYPKHRPADSVVISRLVNEDPDEKLWSEENGALQRDWIVLTTQFISPSITPLRLSSRTVEVGDKVHLVGNPYWFEKTLKVSGRVVGKSGEHIFVSLDGTGGQSLGGASGSPLLNESGHLVGIFSNSVTNPKTGKTTFVINNTDYLKRVLNREIPLNRDRRSLSKWLDSVLVATPVQKALELYDKMLNDPMTPDVYEIHYINRRHLFRIGESMLNAQRNVDAILYFRYLSKKYGEDAGPHLALAKAYIQNHETEKAIITLENALGEIYSDQRQEVEHALNDLRKKE